MGLICYLVHSNPTAIVSSGCSSRSQPDYHNLHLRLHLQRDKEAAKRHPAARQGIRDSLDRKPVQLQPHHVLHPDSDVLDVMDAVPECPPLRVLFRHQVPSAVPALRHRLAGHTQLFLEIADPGVAQPPVSLRAQDLLRVDLLPLQGPHAGRTDRDGGKRLTRLTTSVLPVSMLRGGDDQDGRSDDRRKHLS